MKARDELKFPTVSVGRWPKDLLLDREHMYDDRFTENNDVMTQITIEVSKGLVDEARTAGLLDPKAIEAMIREYLREERAEELFKALKRMDAAESPPPMTPEEIAEEIRTARSERRKQYLSEIADSTFDRITVNADLMNGQPCIRGMRLTVGRIFTALATSKGWSEVIAEYPDLEEEDIRQALEFAAISFEKL